MMAVKRNQKSKSTVRSRTRKTSSTKGEKSMAEVAKEPAKAESASTGLNIRLAPVNNSDQPVLANFTRLNGAPGMVFVDFGFLEPAALSALSRLAQSGGKIPENLNGKLATRVALGFDTAAALHQQLGQVMASLKAQVADKADKKEAKR
jgi:hypothetical protein